MKAIRLTLGLVLLLGVGGMADVQAQWATLDSTSLALLDQGIGQLHAEKYQDAICTFREVIGLHPDSPMGYFFVAVVFQTMMRNYRVNTYDAQFENFLDLAIEMGERAVKANEDDPLNHLYLGGARGFRGLHKVRRRDWLGAFGDGRKGVSNLKTALKRDPDLNDAYYGLGTYHYWLGARSKLLRLLLFYGGDRQQGIREIQMAQEKGRFTRIECMYALTAIYYEEKEFEKALSLNQKLHRRFPTNPSCLYMRSRLFEQLGRWKEAREAFQNLLAHITESPYTCTGYRVECYCGLARCNYQLGEFAAALDEINRALSLKDQRHASRELEGPLEDFDEIVAQAEELHEELLALDMGAPTGMGKP